MKIEMYDKVVLKDGRKGNVIEIFENGKAYMIDIMTSPPDWEKEIYPEYEEVIVKADEIVKVTGNISKD